MEFVFLWTWSEEGCKIMLLSGFPDDLDKPSFLNLLSILDTASLCPGNTQSHFVEMAKARQGTFTSSSGEATAKLENFPITTIRRSTCLLVSNESECTIMQSL